jgi:hypothetical protein
MWLTQHYVAALQASVYRHVSLCFASRYYTEGFFRHLFIFAIKINGHDGAVSYES